MRLRPRTGAMGDAIEGEQLERFALAGGEAVMFDKTVALDPMIGVIGTAPCGNADGEGIDTCTPGTHGGNMDVRLITAGSTLYLPVNAPGALLSMGDVHALMGDGEVAICGLECSAEVDVRVRLIKGRAFGWPVLRARDGSWHVLASAFTLDEAAKIARYALLDFLAARTACSANQLVMLMSVVGQLQICQVVDPLMTVRMGVPANAFLDLDF